MIDFFTSMVGTWTRFLQIFAIWKKTLNFIYVISPLKITLEKQPWELS